MPRENTGENSSLKIKSVIQEIVKKFALNADIKDFLTEDDLRCHLFAELKSALIEYPNASLHAEVRWYGSRNQQNEKLLLYRSDIVVIDKETLESPVGEIFTLPTKGYAFDSYFAILELKLRRPNNRESDTKYKKRVEEDIHKLECIKNRTSPTNDPIFLSVVFDKKRKSKKVIKLKTDNNQAFWVELNLS